MKKVFLLILTVLLFTGCATPTAYISSLTDPRYTPLKTDPIHVAFTDDPSIKDRQFYPFLKNEMISNGFNIVEDVTKAKYYLLFKTDSNTSQINSTLFLPSTSTSYGYVGGTPYSETTSSTIAVPYSQNYTVEKIYLHLFSVEDAKAGINMTIWEGYIGAGEKEYKAYTQAILKSLFDVFGTNYEAHTPIDTNYGK
jgi:hypothetical protein